MQTIKLLIASFLILYSTTSYSSIGKLFSKTGSVHILKNSYFPIDTEVPIKTLIDLDETIMTKKASKAIIKTIGNKTFFLDENASISIRRTRFIKQKKLHEVFLNLNYGELMVFSKHCYITTPQAMIISNGNRLYIKHSNIEKYTSIIAIGSNPIIIKTNNVERKFRLNSKYKVKIYSPDVIKSQPFLKEVNYSPLTKEDIALLENKFNPSSLMQENYKPSFLDNLFRKILL